MRSLHPQLYIVEALDRANQNPPHTLPPCISAWFTLFWDIELPVEVEIKHYNSLHFFTLSHALFMSNSSSSTWYHKSNQL